MLGERTRAFRRWCVEGERQNLTPYMLSRARKRARSRRKLRIVVSQDRDGERKKARVCAKTRFSRSLCGKGNEREIHIPLSLTRSTSRFQEDHDKALSPSAIPSCLSRKCTRMSERELRLAWRERDPGRGKGERREHMRELTRPPSPAPKTRPNGWSQGRKEGSAESASRITDQIRSYRWRERSSGRPQVNTSREKPPAKHHRPTIGVGRTRACFRVFPPFRYLVNLGGSGPSLSCRTSGYAFLWCMS